MAQEADKKEIEILLYGRGVHLLRNQTTIPKEKKRV